jgi:hypothetical protein
MMSVGFQDRPKVRANDSKQDKKHVDVRTDFSRGGHRLVSILEVGSEGSIGGLELGQVIGLLRGSHGAEVLPICEAIERTTIGWLVGRLVG